MRAFLVIRLRMLGRPRRLGFFRPSELPKLSKLSRYAR